jgi:hypothetical protein
VRRLTPLLPFGVLLLLLGLWATQASRLVPSKDWRLYYDTASLALAGRLHEIYPGITPGLPFFYPPFFIWHVIPLGYVPREMAYGCVVTAMSLALVVSLFALRRALDVHRRPIENWIWFVLSSAGCTWMFVTGHISAWYLMLLAVALWLWALDLPTHGGLALSLALTKPHYGLAVLLCVALAGNWRMVRGAVIGGALLGVSSYPLGWSTWKSWLAQIGAASHAAADGATAWKQITVRGFWTAYLGSADGRVTASWVATAVPLALLASWAAWRSRHSPDRLPRVVGLGVLMALACGPYAFHYDGLLLAVPGLVWYLRPESYRVAWVRAGCGVMIVTTYVLQHLGAWIVQGGYPLTGLAIAGWLVLEALDLSRSGTAGGGIAPVVADDVLARLA